MRELELPDAIVLRPRFRWWLRDDLLIVTSLETTLLTFGLGYGNKQGRLKGQDKKGSDCEPILHEI